MNNKIKIIIITGVALVVLAAIGTGTLLGVLYVNPKEFVQEIEASGVFENSFEDRIPQTAIRDVIYNHFFDNQTGKTPKLLFVGYDGALANSIPLQENYEKSAVFRIAENGGMYLGYCGGETPGDQDTSTAPGWATIFTGVWATEHGVKNNKGVLSEDHKSVIYEIGQNGISTSYSVIWDTHIELTYSKEVAASNDNNYPIDYFLGQKDEDSVDDMNSRILSGQTDAIFGILEYPDAAGHGSGVKVTNKKYMEAIRKSEDATFEMIDSIEDRDNYSNEDWLIIIMNDHGGIYFSHGKTSPMENTLFIVSNKPIFG